MVWTFRFAETNKSYWFGATQVALESNQEGMGGSAKHV